MHNGSDMEPSDVIIKLRVTKPGAQEEILNVHRGVLGKSSSFFQNAIKPEWTISREQPDVMDLPDDSAQVVVDYIRWLYSGSLSVKQYNKGHDTRERTAEEAEKVSVLLAEAYILERRYSTPSTKMR
ncbi:uncharacterized protein yc1106_09346 [Curvularia clavata]|uniref:BTB domain-containing protein n=1 Tax=Curvularia clavata TaxID=95742 RepID=A0A9Q9DWP0_CURCL|nr:uncharacterized protein yc1106_09346 [Curvularia clavata]